jgi:hypothetical protein
MSLEAIYTTVILSLSIGFFANSLIITYFIEDKGRYYPPLFALLAVFITFVVEIPRLAFDPLQILGIPIGSAVAFGLFFYAMNAYAKAKSWY